MGRAGDADPCETRALRSYVLPIRDLSLGTKGAGATGSFDEVKAP